VDRSDFLLGSKSAEIGAVVGDGEFDSRQKKKSLEDP
jgi:hypothetical protein